MTCRDDECIINVIFIQDLCMMHRLFREWVVLNEMLHPLEELNLFTKLRSSRWIRGGHDPRHGVTSIMVLALHTTFYVIV